MSADPRPRYLLINSISRSGGTYVKSLFDGVDGILTFPVELSSVKGPVVGFVSQEMFEGLDTPEAWLDATHLSLYLRRFAEKPYRQCFGRHERLDGEPEIHFDFIGFKERLSDEFASFTSVGAAYEFTWRAIFTDIVIDRRPFEHDEAAGTLVNHFPTNVTRDFGQYRAEGESVCDPQMLCVVRDPLEHVSGLARHWSRIASEPDFWKLGLARWEMYLYTALRNRILYGDACDVLLYSFDPELIRCQLARSPLDPLQRVAVSALQPTVLGVPLRGQSYKEKIGMDVRQPYDYARLFPGERLEGLQAGVRRIYDYLEIESFDELRDYRNPSDRFGELVETSGSSFEWMMRRFGEAVDFGASVNLDRVTHA